MNLRETTHDSISLVEERTGYLLQVLEDPALKTVAFVHMASRKALPAHLIRYNPSLGQAPDYLICFQCGFVLRLFANPPEARFVIASPPAGYAAVARAVHPRGDHGPGPPAADPRRPAEGERPDRPPVTFLDGLVTAYPTSWLLNTFVQSRAKAVVHLTKTGPVFRPDRLLRRGRPGGAAGRTCA